jgi:tRNA-2-methylthio-N6-dimethylallyladenosine synthase
VHKVLIEGFSKRSDQDYAGRNDKNAMVVFPVDERYKIGDYAYVLGERCTSATLVGRIVEQPLEA